MELEQKVKLLQAIYAGALADSVFRMGNEGILEKVTSEKREEQMQNGKYRAAQFVIEKPDEVFFKLSELFGCANWAVESDNKDYKAEATKCMLCAMAKKMGAQSPCNIFCLDPMEGMIRGIAPNYRFNATETLWSGQKCEVNLIKEA
ncbi:MAG: L-2-amino-thiazoline-4-carboxylic acid hydrolase [Tissierellia bacterium]|nr:L-2-amino-thiazoline-4-carboxylic acid hydrolase [Tissierellia bacterium]